MTGQHSYPTATPDGPGIVFPFVGEAELDAAVLGRAIEVLPPSVVATRIRSIRRRLLDVEDLHASGQGRPGTGSGTGGGVPVFEWSTSAEAAALTGVTARAITKACSSGRIPGAHHVVGHGWFIPTSVLPDMEDVDDANAEHTA